MKNLTKFIGFTWIILLILLVLVAGDYLALHDIQREYVSQEILTTLGINLNPPLPDWTGTKLEWTVVQVSFYLRLVLLVLGVLVLSISYFIARRNTPKPAEPIPVQAPDQS